MGIESTLVLAKQESSGRGMDWQLGICRCKPVCMEWTSQVALVVKNMPANTGDARDPGSVPGWEDPLKEGTRSSVWHRELYSISCEKQ